MAVFRAGEPCLLIDERDRRFLLALGAGRDFSTHQGSLPHDRLIGSEEGSTHETSSGSRLIALRPRLEDFVLKMKRGAQVVYPKDMGPILIHGDIRTGMTVVEAGSGSGALTLALAEAVGPTGKVVSVERREDHQKTARKTVERWFGEMPPQVDFRLGEVEDVIGDVAPSRLVLDLPEPWHAFEVAASTMPGGAVLTAYVPTVPQMEKTVGLMRSNERFTDIGAREALTREWNVDGRSVRPSHQMVGHTGFLVNGRLLAA